MKKTTSHLLFALVWACFWVAATGRMSAAVYEYVITYTDLTPPAASGGWLSFTSGTQQGGSVDGHAMFWTGPSNSLVNLHPASATYSEVMAGAGNQQAGYTYSTFLWGHHAAIWNGTASSYRDLNPSWSSDSMALATTGARQAGYATGPGYQTRAVVWSGTASSFVDLHPAGGDSSIAHAIAGDQQGGMVTFNGFAHAALWSGTAASYRNLHPLGQFQHSEIFGMTTNQQVGHANARAGVWFGTAESFVDLHPAGAVWSQARATTDTMQAGFAVFDSYRHALLWFGSADHYLDLQLALGSQYRESEAYSVWTDGSTILVAGGARDWPGSAHPVLWSIAAPCTITCPTNLVVCADLGQCGAVVHFTAPLATNCAGLDIECVPPPGSFFPVGTNLVTCVAKDSSGQVKATCFFEVVVRDCEPPVIHGLSASPSVLWPPNNRMQPVKIAVTATDNCEVVNCKIISVTSNELNAGPGIGHSRVDWQLTGDLSLNLRAARSGSRTGRIYTITVQCADVAGNTSTRTVFVTVPHDQRPKPPSSVSQPSRLPRTRLKP